MLGDTIFALSSGRPPAGVAVVRVSGGDSFDIARRLTGQAPVPNSAQLTTVRNPETADIIDRGLVLGFRGPASFTGQDVVEFQIHGGPAVIDALLTCLARLGLRHAEPGEFTRRAFENGKLDLSQAEGLADLLEARTESQRVQALALVGGRLREQADLWRTAIIGLMANAEADLDFSDEGDVVTDEATAGILALQTELAGELARSSFGLKVRDGFTIAIVGEPNVGKSSLLNALARRDVAIVSDVPGTTRDLIEVALDLGGVAVTLVDTAGLRDTDDPVEQQGVARARARAEAADLVLHIVNEPPAEPLGQLVVNKCDVKGGIGGWYGEHLYVSARTGAGLSDLEAWLVDWAGRQLEVGEPALISRLRQRTSLIHSIERLGEAAREFDPVLRAESLRLSARALDEITGRIGTEQVLDGVFGRFCIGK